MRWFVLVIVVLRVATARAEAVETAQVHLDRGIAAFQAGDYTAAHRELASARRLAPTKPNPYRWLALTEVQLGDCTGALANIEQFLARVAADDKRIAELVRLRDLCQRTGVLRITATQAGTTLRIDGAHVGAAPFRGLSMRAGAHVVIAQHPRFTSESRSVVVPAGGDVELKFDLVAAPTPVTRRWWFWTAIAGAAVTVGAAIVIANAGDEPARLPPIQCDPTGCRP